ncbi:MAG: biosynthetic-type acetolactate synthase large subunit [Acidobacteria bacterium]|nr:MAG: biosynthetic-type acetolactate synthase large subunit [Acidobacteriota bacterium]
MGKLTGSEILLESLHRQNVEVIFGLPGGAVLPLYDALYSAGVRHLLVRHEQAAAFAADGYARATGKPGVLLVTSGPGATNVMTGLTSALMDSIPVVALTGQVPASMIGKDGFQEADTIGISLPCTKQNFAAKSAAEIPSIIQRAFRAAVSGRPGPVLVDLPKSVLMEKSEACYPPSSGSGRPERIREWRDDEIERAADMILESRSAVLYVGGGVVHSEGWDALAALAELTQIPVTTTLMGLGAFPSRDPLSLGMLGMHGSYATNTAICKCDLLIAVGARFDDRVTGRVNGFASEARKIQIDVDPSEVNKNVRVDLALVGDAREALEALLDELRRRAAQGQSPAPPCRREWLRLIEAWRAEHPLTYDKYAHTVKPQFVIETLSRCADEDAIVSVDVGQHQMWAAQFFDFYTPRTWLSSSGLGAMGYGFPAAMGAQLAFPDRQVIAIVGDGGFQMTLNDLATVAQYHVPVKIAVINNHALGMVRQWQEIFFEKRYCDIDLNFAPDFAKLAESYGLRGMRVEHRTDVVDAVRDFLGDREPCLVDFWVDPAENVYPIVPPGASLAEMVVEPPPVLVEEESLDDLWAV